MEKFARIVARNRPAFISALHVGVTAHIAVHPIHTVTSMEDKMPSMECVCAYKYEIRSRYLRFLALAPPKAASNIRRSLHLKEFIEFVSFDGTVFPEFSDFFFPICLNV